MLLGFHDLGFRVWGLLRFMVVRVRVSCLRFGFKWLRFLCLRFSFGKFRVLGF